MTTPRESRYGAFLLRLLLDGAPPIEEAAGVDWDVLLDVARRNVVLVRAAARLEELGVALPVPVAAAVAAERGRVLSTLGVMRRIGHACTERGIAFLFPKALQHYPDMGPDLDLLVLARSAAVDRALLAELRASLAPGDLGSRIAGRTAYEIHGCATPLDVSHGRLGVVGEHEDYPAVLVANRRPVVIDGTEFFLPSPDDQLVLQAMQRVYGRRFLRLSDFVYTIPSVRRRELDWDDILRTTTQIGVFDGLCCYLSYVEQIHESLFGAPLLDADVANRLTLDGWGTARLPRREGGGVGFPSVRVNGRLYLAALGADVRSRHWSRAGRLCLVPAVAAAATVRRLARRGGGPHNGAGAQTAR